MYKRQVLLRQLNRQLDIQTDEQTDRQAGRQAGKQSGCVSVKRGYTGDGRHHADMGKGKEGKGREGKRREGKGESPRVGYKCLVVLLQHMYVVEKNIDVSTFATTYIVQGSPSGSG